MKLHLWYADPSFVFLSVLGRQISAMAFWGAEVKPKKPFRLSFEDLEGGSLHLTQVTLGNISSNERTILKCKVGDKRAVFLCSLLPGVAETCSLNLYFSEEVVFSVSGSTSMHLVGCLEAAEGEDEEETDDESFAYDDEDEELEHDDEGDAMGFYTSDSEDEEIEYLDELTSDEDLPLMIPSSGVKIEDITDQDASKPVSDGHPIHDKRIVPVRSEKPAKKKKREANVQDKTGHNDFSEDEDGFPLTLKRKLDEEQPSQKKSSDIPPSEPNKEPPKETEVSVTKKAKKKKKAKKILEQQEISPLNQKKESFETPSQQDATGINGKVEKHNANVVDEGKSSAKKGTVRKYPNGLEVENVSMGKPDGKQAMPGKRVGMIYIGKLKANGKVFDSNVGRKPFEFRLGVGEVIKGWDIGVNGMRVGDKRRLTIPPAMGYGFKGVQGIPPNSWLLFDVELVHVK